VTIQKQVSEPFPPHQRNLQMMTQSRPRTLARMLGLFMLLTILGGVIAQGFISDRLIVFSDAAATANNILSHEGLFKLSLSIYLIEMVANITTTALWYVLLRPVNRPIALVAAFIDLAGCIIKTVARVFYLTPLWVLGAASTPGSIVNPALHGFTPEQLQSIALVLFRANVYGAAIALAFFGFSVPLNGYLIFRSTFLPRWLGALAMIAGVCWLTFLSPPFGSRLFIFTAPIGLLITLVMIFWLLVYGVDERKWDYENAGGL
jgi:hypothetical protein